MRQVQRYEVGHYLTLRILDGPYVDAVPISPDASIVKGRLLKRKNDGRLDLLAKVRNARLNNYAKS
jgi:hypothetical protein